MEVESLSAASQQQEQWPPYGGLMLVLVLICLQMVLTGFLVVGMRRPRLFHRQLLVNNFYELHMKETGCDITNGSYPDMGDGRYAAHLSYSSYLEFNRAQRTHQNYLEQIASVLTLLIAAGVRYPKCAAYAGTAYLLGRFLYLFYLSAESIDHILFRAGVALINLSLAVSFALSMLSAYEIVTSAAA